MQNKPVPPVNQPLVQVARLDLKPLILRRTESRRLAVNSLHRRDRSLRRVLSLFVLATTSVMFGATATWERLAPLPVPNGGFVGAANNGRVIVAGGVTWQGDTKIWLDRIWTYDPERNRWSETGRLEAPVAYSVIGDNGGVVWFAGGSSGNATHRTLWRMDAGRLPQAVASLENGFVNATGGLIGHTLYVAGGTDDQTRIDRI